MSSPEPGIGQPSSHVRARTQITSICTIAGLPELDRATVQIDGYARGCHGLPRFELGPY
jgi:hypothetical protein